MEATRATALGPDEGYRFAVGPDLTVYRGGEEELEDRLAMIEYTGHPGAPALPLHLHRLFDEAWYILEGEVDVQLGDDRMRGTVGCSYIVPRMVPHMLHAAGSGPARWLAIWTPGHNWRFLEEAGQIVPAEGSADVGKVLGLLAKYDTTLV